MRSQTSIPLDQDAPPHELEQAVRLGVFDTTYIYVFGEHFAQLPERMLPSGFCWVAYDKEEWLVAFFASLIEALMHFYQNATTRQGHFACCACHFFHIRGGRTREFSIAGLDL